jgi:polyisoprenyl-phosphate glycosyltransferase
LTAGDSPSGWTSLAILVAGLSGVLLMFMGVLGLYIGAIFDEVKARPHYVVDERINL